MRCGAVVGLLLLCACEGAVEPPRPWSQPPSLPVDLRVLVEPLEVPLLQPITVTLDRFRQDGVEVVFAPAVDAESFVTESTTTDAERAFGNGFWQRTTMVLLPITGPGELTLPSFVAEVAAGASAGPSPVPPATTTPKTPVLRATTPEQTITVTGTLAGHDAAIEAPGEPFPTPFGGWWWLGGGAVLLVLAASFLFWRSRRTERPHQSATALPPHVRALRELQRLRGQPRTTAAEIEAFYVQVSQVLRLYLEQRFGLHAPERTTEEFLRELEGGDGLARQHRRELERFLSQCDLVKFAGLVPAEAEHDTTWQLAENFVESTRADRIRTPASGPEVAS